MDIKWNKINQILEKLYSRYTIEDKLGIEASSDIIRLTYSYLLSEYVFAVEKRLEVTEKLIKNHRRIWITDIMDKN